MKKVNSILVKLIFCSIIVLGFALSASANDTLDPYSTSTVPGCGTNGGGWLSGTYQITCPICWQYDIGGPQVSYSCQTLGGAPFYPGLCPTCITIEPAPSGSGVFTLTMNSTGQQWTINDATTVTNDDGSTTTTFVVVGP